MPDSWHFLSRCGPSAFCSCCRNDLIAWYVYLWLFSVKFILFYFSFFLAPFFKKFSNKMNIFNNNKKWHPSSILKKKSKNFSFHLLIAVRCVRFDQNGEGEIFSLGLHGPWHPRGGEIEKKRRRRKGGGIGAGAAGDDDDDGGLARPTTLAETPDTPRRREPFVLCAAPLLLWL